MPCKKKNKLSWMKFPLSSDSFYNVGGGDRDKKKKVKSRSQFSYISMNWIKKYISIN